MSGDPELLLAEMRRYGRVSLGAAEILSCARLAFDDDTGLRGRLRHALDALATKEAIRLPGTRNKDAWDRSALPPLPLVTTLRTERKANKERAVTTWSDAFAFAANINASDRRSALVAVNDWHRVNRKPWTRLVPYRVRSAQILGDEKAFDTLGLVQGTTICGQVPLSVIGACNPDVPLAREDSGHGPGTMLVVENAHAYSLISDVNREKGVYRSVIWGGGARVMKRSVSILSLEKAMGICGATQVEYVGDVDPEGIRIAASLASDLLPAGVILRPAGKFYERMIAARAFPNTRKQAGVGVAIEWLPPTLREKALRLFADGMRVAQEILDEADVTAALTPSLSGDDSTASCAYLVP